MCCSKTAVHTAIRKFENEGSYLGNKRWGQPRKSTKRDDTLMKIIVSRSPTSSCKKVQANLLWKGYEYEGSALGCSSSKQQVVCDVSHAVILRRSDKRKDRVEISPEMLIQAQQKAEEISSGCAESVHIVGWYHSHPKITVAPSAVDLKTQLGYQQMDVRFVGIIFSVFNKSETTKVCEEVVGGFQALQTDRNCYERINVPVRIREQAGIAPHNQEALCSVSNILQQEQMAVLQQSRDMHAGTSPLQHLYNAAVAVQRVVGLCEQLPGPLCALAAARAQHTKHSLTAVDAHTHYLDKLLRDKGVHTLDDPPQEPQTVDAASA